MSQKASQGLPVWMTGNNPAVITAKMVMASAARLIPVLHCWRKINKIAEINVPACPMPIQKNEVNNESPPKNWIIVTQYAYPLGEEIS